jgi:anhydro-N-acetylmuramic acid kinase
MGEWLADAALAAMHEGGVSRADVAAIASHGQTLWHEPGHSTWQVGDASRIAERTSCPVVSNFRARDVSAGGQGAPLVPMADAVLFAHPTEWRALQNLGGIGNVTVVPPASTHASGGLDALFAFDTGPGCVLIDSVARLVRPGMPYDVGGAMAAAGRVLDAVVQQSLAHPFYDAPPPKSTGRELFTREYVDAFIAACRALGGSDEDIVATATALTARSVADQYRRFVPEPVTEVLLSGGGAHNPVLVRGIAAALAQGPSSPDDAHGHAPPRVRRFDEVFFDNEAKEAVAFALLGYLHLTGRPGNLPRATGARGPRVLGDFTPA